MHTEDVTRVYLIQTAGGRLRERIGIHQTSEAVSLTARSGIRGASEANFCEIFQRHSIHLRCMNDNCRQAIFSRSSLLGCGGDDFFKLTCAAQTWKQSAAALKLEILPLSDIMHNCNQLQKNNQATQA